MRMIYFVLGLLLIAISLLSLITLLPEQGFSNGLSHPSIAHMNSGGDGEYRFLALGTLAFFLHATILLLLLVLVVLGVSEHRRSAALYAWVAVSGIIILVNWWLIYSSYQGYLQSGNVDYFLGFPVPSAWMIYGTWLSGGTLVLLYVLGFNKYIFNADDEAEYLALVNEFNPTALSENDKESM